MKHIISLIFTLFFVLVGVHATDNVITKHDRYVVIISLDGFRWDYNQWYNTPLLDLMARKGVESGLIPCFPSKTFPNHYSIATGLVPDHHGIIHNTFYERETGGKFSLSNKETKMNPKYWHGEPVWLTAKRQGIKTAVFYWPGSDIAIQGEYPDIYHVYDKKPRLTMEERLEGIMCELKKPEKERPHLIMAYSEEPDHNGHVYGPQHKETRKAVEHVDSLLYGLYNDMMKLAFADKIDFLVVSDHGMAIITPEQKIPVSKYLRKEWYTAIEGNMPALIYANEGCVDSIYNALKDVRHLSVWKKKDVPAELSYGTDKNCGDIIASPDLGWIFYDDVVTVGGMHGFDPGFNEMHAIFRAVGPDFKNMSIPHFRNVNIYPLLCELLGLKPANNDGSLEEIKHILK